MTIALLTHIHFKASPKINLNWLSYDIGCPKKMWHIFSLISLYVLMLQFHALYEQLEDVVSLILLSLFFISKFQTELCFWLSTRESCLILVPGPGKRNLGYLVLDMKLFCHFRSSFIFKFLYVVFLFNKNLPYFL